MRQERTVIALGQKPELAEDCRTSATRVDGYQFGRSLVYVVVVFIIIIIDNENTVYRVEAKTHENLPTFGLLQVFIEYLTKFQNAINRRICENGNDCSLGNCILGRDLILLQYASSENGRVPL